MRESGGLMERLTKKGLHGAELVKLDTPRLVQRYNDCLQAIGRPPTALERFHVDGKGSDVVEKGEEKGGRD